MACRGRGIRRGDRVVCWTGTRLDVVPLFAALARMGAVYCPLPANLGPEEAAHVLAVAEPALLIVDADYLAGGQVVPAGCTVLRLDERRAPRPTRRPGSSRTRPKSPIRTCCSSPPAAPGRPRA